MNQNNKKKLGPKLLWYYALGVIAVWSLFISLSLVWHHKIMSSGALDAAIIEARGVFQNHIIYRSWNAGHGGLYAPITPKTQPNPYLDIPERDVQTVHGKKLTIINPSFMTRQVNEMALEKFKHISHITSLKPVRIENKPDEWEIGALKNFEKGKDEVSSLEIINGTEHMRLMRPLITEKSCLKCHAKQGYRLGDIRGGISVAVPMEPHFSIQISNFKSFIIIYFLVWIAGLFGTILFMTILGRQIEQRLIVEKELRRREKLEGVIEMARAVCHELNQPLQMIIGNTEILMLDDIDDPSVLARIKIIKDQVDRMGKMTRKLISIASYKTMDMPQGKVIDINKSSKDH
ncbi:MAG: DUF3365 domain-containing protein [Desulfobacteraceae bacterium]|nr:DUF3365 domain-containing protein [Desulfobacteraceae bacterium]